MKKLLFILTTILLLSVPKGSFAQAPPLGTAADFVLFSTVGAVSNTGLSHLTGNVGTNSGLSTGFGNVDGVMHDNNLASAQCAADLLIAYNFLNAAVPTFFPAPLLGNGQVLAPGVYLISAPATLNLDLTLDALGDPNALFIIQIQGSFSAAANSEVKLINGALACNVFWKIEGLVSTASGTSLKGTIIANNSAINLATGNSLEGRALSTTGAITIDGTLAYKPIGCGSPVLTGPLAPVLGSAACYTLFSADGPVTNVGVTYVVGDVGTNLGSTLGFDPLNVTGMIHPIPDGSTASCATDLLGAYNYLNTLAQDIELLYPAQFGNSLVLTPHTYVMNGATTFTDSLFLNAQGNPNAIFVIKIYGALSTSTFSKVTLTNGAKAENVYWMVNGAVSINDFSEFVGTIVCNNGAMSLNTGVILNGRALTTTGALNTSAINATMPLGCGTVSAPLVVTAPANQTACLGDSVSFIVIATGTNLTYQWRRGSVNLIDGGNISGATNDTLTINPVSLADAATDYNVIVTGTFSPDDTSNNFSLTINTAPVITTQPVDETVCEGNAAVFSVIASGGSLTYQWRKGIINLINGGNISGATSATLNINPANLSDTATNYNVIVMGTCMPNDTSVNVFLMVNPTPLASANSNSPVCTNSSIFLMADTVAGATYLWTNASGFSSTDQNAEIILAGSSDAGIYSLVVTLNGCSSIPSTVNVIVDDCIADLSVVKTVNNTHPIFGNTVVFTITVTNNGPGDATGAEVTDIIQSGYVFVSSSATTGMYDPITGVWSIGNLANGAAETLTITVTVTENGNYVNTAIVYGNEMDGNMNDNVSSVETIPSDFFIPEGFSPNGDAINDVFVIRGILNYPDNTFIIFNRWGQEIFQASPYENTWDGTRGGNDLPTGTYFYVLDLGDGSEVYKGTIYLNR